MTQPVEDVRLMRRVGLGMLGGGGAVCAAGVLLKPLTPGAAAAQALVAAGFGVWFLVFLLAPPRRWILEGAALIAIAQLAAVMATSNVVGTTPFFFLWPCVFLAYFGGERVVALSTGLLALAVPVACAVNPYLVQRTDTAVGTVASVGVMSWLVLMMTRRSEELSRALEDTANTDALTGLLNRRGLQTRLGPMVDDARERDEPLSVVLIDIDHFKRFNDRYGHEGGDAALVRLAEAIRSCSADVDVLARIGGEEFVAVLVSQGGDGARDFAERLRRALATGDATEIMTVSAGVATLGADLPTGESLLRCADIALYESKAAGRDRVTSWTADRATPVPAVERTQDGSGASA